MDHSDRSDSSKHNLDHDLLDQVCGFDAAEMGRSYMPLGIPAGVVVKRCSAFAENSHLLNDIKNVIKWKDDIGYLPGSVCRFKLDQDGDLMLLDDFEEESSVRKKQRLMVDYMTKEHTANDGFLICKNCESLGFKADFVKNGQYCKECSNLNPVYLKMFRNETFLSNHTSNSLTVESVPIDHFEPNLLPGETTDPEKIFTWQSYLSKHNYVAAPVKSFLPSQTYPSKVENHFEVGMKLEATDPAHPSRFCVLTVVEKCGFRLRLHFDGYKRKYDFWVNANSEFIFPANFCVNTGRKLESPRGIEPESFQWESYLEQTNAVAAPSHLFSIQHEDKVKRQSLLSLGFDVNLKLEAVDKANTALVCVATIKDILNNYMLIHFDGWDDSYDYWTTYDSPLIHPVGWCKTKGKSLTPPKDFLTDNFTWEVYLQETNSSPVPSQAFRNGNRPVNAWKSGMKLECVDVRNPRLIRVATIVNRQSNSVKIHFDGWNEMYDYWIDEDSGDLHPINWCQKTNHPLQPPPSYDLAAIKQSSCTVSHCTGLGHQRWYLANYHNKAEDCPYFTIKLDHDLSDRFECSEEDDENEDDLNEELNEIIKIEKAQYQLLSSGNTQTGERTDVRRKLYQLYTRQVVRQESNTIEKLSPTFIESCKHLFGMESFTVNPLEVIDWDCNRVEQFVHSLLGCNTISQLFSKERIDGESFLMLRQNDLVLMGVKLGHAVKIYNSVLILRHLLLNAGQL